jgi:hypothetical protein
MDSVDSSESVKTNPKPWERFKLAVDKHGWIALIVVIVGGYAAFVWRVNSMIVERADVERELQAQISELKGKVDILIEDRASKQQDEFEFPW